ncbi:HalD/BesD family halogenase [Pseudonocardia endophytica]|uniref:HalD/BesD family halogenase n=1 Tax=Pseudonocardia endophytica TaxID=401976 RepID=UPI0014052269|nr:arpA protein [Pseudonocardia endophytica]
MSRTDVSDVIDTERYPLHDPSAPAWTSAVARARKGLASTGCAVLPGVVPPSVLERLHDEGDRVAPDAHYETRVVNVYNTAPDPTLPPDHPARVPLERGNAFVARDRIPEDLAVHRLYRDPGFRRFLSACADMGELHELADPLAGLCLNVVTPGRSHPWHFDTNEVAISLLTRAPEAGGVFEYCPDIRSAGDENTAAVADVLAGRGEHLVRRITLNPGDLQIFRGRYSLHRVTEVSGSGSRHSAIFSYSSRPGVVGSEERTRQLFGRVLAEHVAPRGVRVDELMD